MRGKLKTKNKKIKLIFWILIFFLLFFIGWGRKIVSKIYQSPIFKNEKVNLIFFDYNNLFLFSLNPQEEELKIFTFPGDLYLETVYGYGKYKINSLFDLDSLEKKEGRLFLETIKENLFFPFDGYLISEEKIDFSNKNSIIKSLFQLLKNKKQGNLSRVEIFWLWLKIKGFRQDKIYVQGEKEKVLKKVLISSKEEGWELDEDNFLKIIGNSFSYPQIIKESFSLAIFNGTSYQRLGERVAKRIEVLGGRVVEIDNYQENLEDICLLITTKEKKESFTAKKVSSFFDCRWQEAKEENRRWDLTLVIGKKYWQKLKEKW
ncbi:MAG: LCP family protein [Microgenomates group bacterium]